MEELTDTEASTLDHCVEPGEELPLSPGCDRSAIDCRCFETDDPDADPCTCTEATPGEIQVTCDRLWP